ncbi:MAG: ABC transporter ATP-binding protein [Pyrinomonadaceae bacterium]|nr:ABC transporter ATP-binding protein [Pyrinomonadaceae bacterium]
MSENSIEIVEATKLYGKLVAVDAVSLQIKRGEVYALVGANGAGKSSLMRAIVGLAQLDAGRISICGHDTKKNLLRAKRHTGYLPEELLFYERLTGKEYLRLVAGLKEADTMQVEDEIEFYELKTVEDKWIGGYSLGMRKKLGLAAAMTGRPQVLVLDEPLNGLDVEMMRKLRGRIKREQERGCTLLVSSHVMDFVERTSNRVGIMRAGRLVAEGTPEELRNQAGLSDAPFEDVFFGLASGKEFSLKSDK